ncbi:MAG: TAXI family TRAP transporter solute-binding subunit [Porticoccaceae bacterium]
MRGFRFRFCSIFILLICCAGNVAGEQKSFRLGTGGERGVYYQYGEDLIGFVENSDSVYAKFTNISTGGSIDNLERIRAGELDVAIVQNDIGHYAYNGKHGQKTNQDFLAGIPLFSEYLQIVIARDGDVRLLGDLRLKVISAGTPVSGSYWNAIDLLSSLGMKQGLDYRLAGKDVIDPLTAVLEREIDAAIFTRASAPPELSNNASKLDILDIPSEIARSLAVRKPYYHAANLSIPQIDGNRNISTLSVVAYLVISRTISDEDAELIINTVIDSKKNELKQDDAPYKLVNIPAVIKDIPFPYHSGAEMALSNAGLLSRSISKYYLVPVLLMLIWLVRKARNSCLSYDCLGNAGASSASKTHRLLKIISDSGTFLYISIVFCLVVVVIVLLTQYFDVQYARELNIDSPFSEVTFLQAVIWMFLFISSGHSGEMFPISPAGQVLVGLMPLVGFMAILGFFYTLFEKRRKLLLERMRGTVVKKVYDHVLVCGWNEKVPGLIYGLTSKDAPRRRQVVVVADIDGDSEVPFCEYGFDHNYVSYCRGDSADLEILAKAQAEQATDAVIVAGIKKRDNKNLSSILSVLSLKQRFSESGMTKKREKDNLFISAEMVYEENKELFLSCGVDAVISPDLILNRLLICCCFSDYISDFLLDILTHDDYSEIYSVKISDLEEANAITPLKNIGSIKNLPNKLRICLHAVISNKLELTGKNISSVKSYLFESGINLIGVSKHQEASQHGLIDQVLDNASPFNLLLSDSDKEYELKKEDSLLVLADDYSNIESQILINRERRYDAVDQQLIECSMDEIVGVKILLVGDSKRVKSVYEILKGMGVDVCYTTQEAEGGSESDNRVMIKNLHSSKCWEDISPWRFDTILICANEDKLRKSDFVAADHGDLDSHTIMAARVLRNVLASNPSVGNGKPTRIVAEMINYKCRHLFEDALVDVIVPITVVIQRMLTSLVFNHGLVCSFLAGMLAVEDGIFLRTLEVDETQQCCGMTLDSVFRSMGKGVQLWGYLPVSGREELKKLEEDFECHFATNATGKYSAKRVEPGDVLILACAIDKSERAKD